MIRRKHVDLTTTMVDLDSEDPLEGSVVAADARAGLANDTEERTPEEELSQ